MMSFDFSLDQRRQPALHRAHALIEIQRAEHGFKRIGQQGLARPAAAARFAFAQPQVIAQANLIRQFAQFLGAHQRRSDGGQPPFGEIGILPKEPVRHDEIEHRIAQKFQPLVVFRFYFGMLVQIRAMRQGARQQSRDS